MTSGLRGAQRLGIRLAFLLAVALLPLGVISSMQAHALLKETRERSQTALLGATRLAAAQEVQAIQRAQGSAETLSRIIPKIGADNPICATVMKEVVEESSTFSFASFTDPSGRSTCNSAGRTIEFGVTAALKEAAENVEPRVRVMRNATISKTSVILAQQPVLADDGRFLGLISISLPHAALKPEPMDDSGAPPLMLLTFNADGDVITSSVGLDAVEDKLPKDRSLAALASNSSVAFTAPSNAGVEHTFSVVPLVAGNLYAMGSWPADALPQAFSLSSLPPFAVPTLMWIVSLAVAMLATERLVTRHITKLTGAITRFAGGNRIVGPLNFADAPDEIRAAGDAFERMTASILRDEAELENTVHQKEVLLREVHHRVKNNLQLIASIMNMQARRAHTPETKIMVRRLQERVMSLATIHRGLYQTSGLADVRADELLQDILRQILNMAAGPGHHFDVDREFEPIRLTPDQAVPLALLVTEALTNAMKYARGTHDRAQLRVRLRHLDKRSAELVVANSMGDSDEGFTELETGEPTGLGTQLIAAFVGQLDGRIEREKTANEYLLRVTFPIGALADGELRESEAETSVRQEA